MKSLLRTSIAAAALILAACQSAPAPQPAASPEPAAPSPEPAPVVMLTVNASALNIRSDASLSAEILTQAKRGERVTLLESGESWMMVQLPDGRTGWAASRFLLRDGEKASKPGRRGNCLPDSDFAIANSPTPTFSDSGIHGEVVVDAHVDAKGNVKSTEVVRNSTGDEALAFLTEREIKTAKFIAPVRDCKAREFIFTYKRTF